MMEELPQLFKEQPFVEPEESLAKQSNVWKWMQERGIKNIEELLQKSQETEWFWTEVAKELKWFKEWNKVLEWNPPYSKWFIGGKTNIVLNALDRHLGTPVEKKTAFIWVGENGEEKKITYKELSERVGKLANALKKMGVKKGDAVAIYLPVIIEAPIAMLACAKIGAVHSVAFSGFSSLALRERINSSEAKIVITCDGYYRRGKVINAKASVDEAISEAPLVKKVIVVKRARNSINMEKERDYWYHEITENEEPNCKTEEMDSEDTLFLLYNSGTVGKPKEVIHVHGGYSVGAYITMKWVFDVKEKDVWWCTADVGWITGHNYVVYAPLMNAVTSVIYEGAPDYPTIERWWEIIEKYRVTLFYTAPTAVRMFMKFGAEPIKKHDISSLRILGSVGEPISPEVWKWYRENIGGGKCPIMDTWWQTECGMHIITPLPITKLRAGSATREFPGIKCEIFDEDGKPISGKAGYLVITKPWPAMLRGIHGDPEKFFKSYWSKYPGVYLTGDAATKDEFGYYWIQGRTDDIIKVAGHRLSTMEIESAVATHESVSEVAVIGKPHEIKGESIKAFVVLKKGFLPSEEIKKGITEAVVKEIGPIARPDEIDFIESLPKTRSGKTMRRILKAKELGLKIEDTGTIDQ